MWHSVKRTLKTIVHAVSVLTFAASTVGIDRTWEDVKNSEYGWFSLWIILFLVSGLFQIYREALVRRAFSMKARLDVVRKLLATLASCFKHLDPLVRTNVMLVTPDGRPRTVQKETAHGMAGDPDEGLDMEIHAGVSGQAARSRKLTLGDLRYSPGPGQPGWGLTAPEQARIRPTLKSILSTPIYDPENPEGDVIGTLQVDSDEPMDKIFENAERVAYVATTFADALALLLKDGG
jgi:hypothetical protein